MHVRIKRQRCTYFITFSPSDPISVLKRRLVHYITQNQLRSAQSHSDLPGPAAATLDDDPYEAMLAAASNTALPTAPQQKDKARLGPKVTEKDLRLLLVDGRVLEDSERCEDLGIEDDMVLHAVYRNAESGREDVWESVDIPVMEDVDEFVKPGSGPLVTRDE